VNGGRRRSGHCCDTRDGARLRIAGDALRGILAGEVKGREVVVIRYEGPRGGPGMQEMLSPTAAIVGAGLRARSLQTGDFRAGHVACASVTSLPKRRPAGPLPRSAMATASTSTPTPCRIELRIGDDELRRRLEELPPFEPKVKRGWLARYLLHVSSADTGAVFEI